MARIQAGASENFDGYQYVGTFARRIMAGDGTELGLSLSKSQLMLPAEPRAMLGLRAYFVVPSGAQRAKVSFEGVADAIDRIAVDETTLPMYNLSGQRVGTGYHGIVIRGGKKMVK